MAKASHTEDVVYPFDSIQWTDNLPKEFVGRCPFCKDSQHHKNKGHLYISKENPVYICHRCSKSGSVYELEQLLNEKCKWEYDNSYHINYNEYNIRNILKDVNDKVNFDNSSITDDEAKYLFDRCNFKTTNDIAQKTFNLISEKSVIDLFPDNKRMITNRTWFLSALGTVCTGRTRDPNNDVRYVKFNIEKPWNSDVISDTYIINNYNLKKKPSDTLIIAEGIFDIIPLFINCRKYGLSDSCIFSACLGSFYARSERTYQTIFSSRPKRIEIFADKGISIDTLREQFKNKLRTQKISVHYPMIKDWNETGPIRMTCNI